MLIVVAGLPGAGKSTLAADLGRALNCAALGVDQAEATMWRAGVSPSGPAPARRVPGRGGAGG